jgi:uncharacterized protein YkwD
MKKGYLCSALIFLSFFSFISFIPVDTAGLANDVLQQTNRFRHSRGLPDLIMKEELNAIAQKHSNNMAKGRVGFGHGGFNRRDVEARRRVKGITSFAENVAYGPTTGKKVVDMWKKSPNHRRNMLGRYKYIGIGTAKDRKGRIYYTQVFAG